MLTTIECEWGDLKHLFFQILMRKELCMIKIWESDIIIILCKFIMFTQMWAWQLYTLPTMQYGLEEFYESSMWNFSTNSVNKSFFSNQYIRHISSKKFLEIELFFFYKFCKRHRRSVIPAYQYLKSNSIKWYKNKNK